VRLGVGPEVQVVLGGEALHPVDVPLQDVDQHDGRGRVHPLDHSVECSSEPMHFSPTAWASSMTGR
jgi:hypothetical protein